MDLRDGGKQRLERSAADERLAQQRGSRRWLAEVAARVLHKRRDKAREGIEPAPARCSRPRCVAAAATGRPSGRWPLPLSPENGRVPNSAHEGAGTGSRV